MYEERYGDTPKIINTKNNMSLIINMNNNRVSCRHVILHGN
jgi:hypothetical protein